MELSLALVVFAAIGAAVGFLAGLVGIGGGLVIVPALVWWFRANGLPLVDALALATGTSLAAIGSTCLLAAIAQLRAGSLDLRAVRPLVVPVVLGALAGPWIALATPLAIVQFGLVALYLYAGWGLAMRSRKTSGPTGACPVDRPLEVLARPLARTASGVTAAVAGMAGIAGNTLMIPMLARTFGLQFKQAVAIASALAVPLCFVGSASYAAQPAPAASAELAQGMIGAVYLPAGIGLAIGSALTVRLGAAVGKRLASVTLERFFAALLVAAALKLVLA